MSSSAPNLFGDDDSQQRRGGVGSTIIIGVLCAIIALLLIFDYRDQIVAALPGLAPALPQKAAPRPAIPPPLPPPPPMVVAAEKQGIHSETEAWMTLSKLSFVVGLVIGGMVVPFLVPPILSRRGYLSVSRWLILGGTIGVMAAGNSVFVAIFASQISGFGFFYAGMSSLLIFPFYFSFVGCFLAAAIHPKPPAGGL